MSGFRFYDLDHGVMMLPMVASWVLLLLMERRRRRQLSAFCEEGSHPWMQDLNFRKRRTRSAWLMALSMLCCCVALMRPVWSPKVVSVQGQGRDLIFMLDVSRSMLAKDVVPNRLTMAKEVIRSAMQVDRADRYGLILFAGSSSIKSPLTQDRHFILEQLELAGPHLVHQGGTILGDALSKTIHKIVPQRETETVDIITITDGEDLGPLPEKETQEMKAKGLRWIIVGLGDDQRGSRIPSREGSSFVTYQNKEVWSRLNGDYLRALSQSVDAGVYYHAGLSRFDLGKVLSQLRVLWPAQEREGEEVKEWTEGAPIALGFGFLFLSLSFFVQWRWRFPQAWFWAITVLVCLPLDEVKADAMPITDAMQIEEQAGASTNVHHSALFENASPSGHHRELLLASSDNVAQDQKRPKADEFLAEEQDKWKKRLAEHPKDESAKFQLAMIAYRRDAPHDALAQFSDLGDSSEVEAVVLACRFNQALCWLAIGELNEELMADAEMDMEALEELESPESCVQTAIELCRTILDYEPHYGQAGGLLEQIWKELYGEGEPDSTSDSENSSSQEEQDETSPDTKEEASNEEEGEEQQESEASSSSSSSDASDEASQAYQMEQLELPPPSLSPQDVIKQQKASQSKRKRGSGKKTVAVEKDW